MDSAPSTPRPEITPFVLGEFATNCYIVRVPGRSACWIVDCGERPASLLRRLDEQSLMPAALLLTHTHADHIAGVDEARSWARARGVDLPVIGPRAEAGFCADPGLNLSAYAGQPMAVTEPGTYLDGGETLELEGTTWRVLATPGHSPGGLTFVHEDSGQAIVGDTLFAGSIGRSDFPTSDPARLRHSLHEVLMKFPDDTVIHPGHGPSTTIGRERRSNPFLRPGAMW